MLAPKRCKHGTQRRVETRPTGETSLKRGPFLVVVRGRCGFLSLRDPTTRWSGHPLLE